MKQLSNSKLRKNPEITAFTAEIIRYVAGNDIQAGESFCGIPGHKEERYAKSKQITDVITNEDDNITIVLRASGKAITINPNDYLSCRDGDERQPRTPKAATTTDVTPTSTTANTDALGALSALLEQQKAAGKAEAEAAAKARENELLKTIKELKNKSTGTVINVNIDGKITRTETEKILDPNFGMIVKLLSCGENVYLYGPAGSGKNVICEETAKALGVAFYYQNTILTKFDLSGYKNAGGEYEETEFYKAWTKGGLFMLDEIDNSTAEALVALNAALANGYFTFPGVGKVAKHKDFYCIAAGNTNGQGATDEYCGRYKMDESSRDRFAFVEINYNSKVEEAICKDHPDVLAFVHNLRKAAKSLQLSVICGYRALTKLCKMYNEDTRFVLNAYIFRGMQADDINELKSLMNGTDKFTECLKSEF